VVSLFADRRTLRTMRLTHRNQQQRGKVYHTRAIHRAAVRELDLGARTRLRAGDASTFSEARPWEQSGSGTEGWGCACEETLGFPDSFQF
jgi:hypothetical protein